jgi:WxcM-like, C-terminal
MPDPILTVRGCRWISIAGVSDPRGRLNFIETGKGLDFLPKRIFWLRGVPAEHRRGRHGHRQAQLVIVALAGGCQVHLDDGKVKETVVLGDPGKGLHVGPFVWQELSDFSAGAVVLVLASMPYEDAEFIRDYDEFKRLTGTRVA